jgi:integrase
MSKARAKLATIEEELEAGQLPARNRTMVDATTSFEDYCKSELAFSTYRKNRNVMRQLRSFAGECHIVRVRDWTTELLDRYRAGREVGRVTALKELEIIRQFFSFCLDRGWAKSNPAAAIKTPRNVRPTDKRPYTQAEWSAIWAACETFGRTSYERQRARGMLVLLRHTGLRISDVALLERSRVQDGRIWLRTLKTGGEVYLPLTDAVFTALEALPDPRNAPAGGSPFYFWNGTSSKRAAVGSAERMLAAVFRKSGVVGAHAHRFRHTLASNILAGGGTMQDVADVLGISIRVAQESYAKWTPSRQARIDHLMRAVQELGDPATKQDELWVQ